MKKPVRQDKHLRKLELKKVLESTALTSRTCIAMLAGFLATCVAQAPLPTPAAEEGLAEATKADTAGLGRKVSSDKTLAASPLPLPQQAKLHCAPVVVPKLPGLLTLGSRVFALPGGAVGFMCSEEAYKSDAVSETRRSHALVSHDGGISWSDYAQDTSTWTYAPRLRNGTWLDVGSHGWENHPDTPEERRRLTEANLYIFDAPQGNAPGTLSVIHRLWRRCSTDAGRTWSERTELLLPQPMPHLATYGRPIVLRNGTYLAPMWGRFDLKDEPKYVSALVLRSTDSGRTWQLVRVARSQTQDFSEHEIVQAANGDVISVIRTTAQRELWQASSHDGGRTWTDLHVSGMAGSTPALLRLRSALVCIYARRSVQTTGTTGMGVAISRDSGRSWRSYLLWDAQGATVDGYPTVVALPHGRVCASFGALSGGRLSGWVATFDPAALP